MSQHILKEYFSSGEGLYIFLNSMNNSIHQDIHQIDNQLQESLDKLRQVNYLYNTK